MKKIVFSLLCVLILGVSSCIKDGDNISNHSMFAVVGSSNSMQPTIITEDGTILAPDLMEYLHFDLFEGDALIVSFSINYDNQPSTEYYTASNLIIVDKIGKSYPIPTSGGESTESEYFSTPIEEVVPYPYLIGNTLFFAFGHTAPIDQEFEYEMTYDRDEDNEIPTIYLRAKSVSTGSGSERAVGQYYAFDMYYFFTTHKDSDNNVKFNIKYKVGVNEDGTGKYNDLDSNPLTIKVN